ncbi:MAG: translation initiation factor [Parafilimonas sp.]
MNKKYKADSGGFVYSTNPDFKFEHEDDAEKITLPDNQQKLKIKLETKHRAGKAVTIVEGFEGTFNDMEVLCKNLKNYCGTGGSVKDKQIIIQGDNRDKILQWLQKNGYRLSKKI